VRARVCMRVRVLLAHAHVRADRHKCIFMYRRMRMFVCAFARQHVCACVCNTVQTLGSAVGRMQCAALSASVRVCCASCRHDSLCVQYSCVYACTVLWKQHAKKIAADTSMLFVSVSC
jgi:hypothetical protein